MMAAWNKHGGIIITLLAFLGPMACHGAFLINFPILCDGGWVRPRILGPLVLCPNGSRSDKPLPLPSPSPSPSPNVPDPLSGASKLRLNYYSSHPITACRDAETTVKEVVEAAIASQGRRVGAKLIRLFFHDCFVDGCDSSVLLEITAAKNDDTELKAGPNKDSLGGMDVIDQAKDALEKKGCPRSVVSCADIVAFAARDAARSLSDGMIDYKIPAGRWDGKQSFGNRTDSLPSPFTNIGDLVAKFALQGLNQTDLVVASGAHSIGKALCAFVSDSAGNVTIVNGCQSNRNIRVDQDNKTPNKLDKKYYGNVGDGNALFNSDYALNDPASPVTRGLVKKYQDNLGNVFEKDYGETMIKMGQIKVKTEGDQDVEIRKQCWTVNQ